jgi:hypothetical protein
MHNKLLIDTKNYKAVINDTNYNLHKGYDLRIKLAENESHKIKLRRTYDHLLEQIKDGGSSRNLNENFRRIVQELYACDEQNDQYLQEFARINHTIFDERDACHKRLHKRITDLEHIKNKQHSYHVHDKDVENIIEYTKDISQVRRTLQTLEPTYFVATMADDGNASMIRNKTPLKNIDLPSVKKRLKANMFKFKNVKECISRARATFMSREDIIKAIENDIEFKSKMPSNFKKLSKEELCKKIDSVINTN